MKKTSVLLGSSIQKNNTILAYFFRYLEKLNVNQIDLSYCFIDDNTDKKSSEIMNDFVQNNKNAILLDTTTSYDPYQWDQGDHQWSFQKIEKIAFLKNEIIKYFLKSTHDYLFFLDSDLILHPFTLQTLIDSEKDIISNIFWTQWSENQTPLPQVWQKDFYTLYDDHMLFQKTEEEKQKETQAFIEMLKIPGIYKVGGLGACTLIHRKVLEAGVNFSPLYNISFWGEDRSFCIRAVANNFELHVNTYYPAFHFYRSSDLSNLEAWVAKNY